MNIRPLYDRVIVKRLEAEVKTKSGLYIPETAKEKPIQGQVIAVGNGKRTEDGNVLGLEVKVNDRVLLENTVAPRSSLRAKSGSFFARTRSSPSSIYKEQNKNERKKDIVFSEARASVLRGVNQLADAVKVTSDQKVAMWSSTRALVHL